MIKHVNIPYGDSNFNISIVEDFEYKNPIEVYHNIIVNSNIQLNTTIYPNFEKEFSKRNLYLNETEKQKLQIEESDEQRRRRSRGRRSLISGSDVGVDKLGQRIGEL